MKLSEMSAAQLEQAYQNFKKEYDAVCELGIDLDISRGKPNGAQLDLSNGLMTCLDKSVIDKCSFDYRNYGVMEGVPSSRKMLAPLLGVAPGLKVYGIFSSKCSHTASVISLTVIFFFKPIASISA